MQSGCIVNLKHVPTVQSNFRRNSTDSMRHKNEFLESRLQLSYISVHKISARLRWYSFKFKTEECSFSSQLNNRLSSCASFNTFIGQYCTATTMYNKKRIEIDIKRDLRASNKFLEGIPVLARFATGPLEEVPPQKERPFSVFFLSLLAPYSSFSSPHSYHYFQCRVRYTRLRVDIVVDRQEGIHTTASLIFSICSSQERPQSGTTLV